ncbi:MAG: polysaccharide pyruvyl transferase family protein [Caldiserica bacterium]|nr:polysaccharide pyruvyl transferase family protein [Caldisericota bacterium]
MVRLFVLGYYGFGNFGDELILAAVQDELASIDCEAVFAVNKPDQYARPVCPRHTLVDRHDGAAMRTALRACDHVMLGGGGLVQDVTSWRSSLYYLGIPLVASLCKKGVISYAQGVGPVRRLWIRRLVRAVFGRMILIDVRDDGSRDLLRACGIRMQEICVSSDAGLSYLVARHSEPVETTHRESRIVACVNERFGWTPEETASFLDCLGSQSSARLDLVVLFPSADLAFTRAVRDRLLTPSELIISPQPLPLLDLCSSAALTVAGRYHMAVAAVAARSPVVALAYDPKVSQLAEGCGFDAIKPGDSPQQAARRVRAARISPVAEESIGQIRKTSMDRIARLKAALEHGNP